MNPRPWDFGAAIFVSAATNLATSGNLSLGRIFVLTSCLLLAISLFGSAGKLAEIERHWRETMEKPFKAYAYNSKDTAGLRAWWRLSRISFVLFVASVILSAVQMRH